MAKDPENSLRHYVLATVISILIGAGGCYGNYITAKVDAVEDKAERLDKSGAVMEQDLRDFRRSFEDFKTEWRRYEGQQHKQGKQ